MYSSRCSVDAVLKMQAKGSIDCCYPGGCNKEEC